MSQLSRSNAAAIRAANAARNASLLSVQDAFVAMEAEDRQPQRTEVAPTPRGVINQPAKPKKEFTMNELSQSLILVSLSKLSDPLHPNFLKALDRRIELAEKSGSEKKIAAARDRKQFVLDQRHLTAQAWDKHQAKPLVCAIEAVKACGRASKLMAADLIRAIMKDACFEANLMWNRAERADRMTPSEWNEEIAANLDALTGEGDPNAQFDEDERHADVQTRVEDARLDSQVFDAPVGMEPPAPYSGPSTDEIEDAITAVNVWLQQVARALFTRDNDREYFGLDPLPFTSLWDAEQEVEHHHFTFGDARRALDAAFKARTRVLTTPDDERLAALAAM